MNIDERLILYTCLQYGYSKLVRTSYRLNTFQLNVLIAIYYGSIINPQRWGKSIKQCIKTINPHMNSFYILRDLNVLNNKGLIDYNETNPKKYWVKLTKEGKQVIEGLFDTDSIDYYIGRMKDKI